MEGGAVVAAAVSRRVTTTVRGERTECMREEQDDGQGDYSDSVRKHRDAKQNGRKAGDRSKQEEIIGGKERGQPNRRRASAI